MDTHIGIFLGSFVIGLSGAMMPGPMFVAVVGQSPRRGAWTGPVVVLGHGVLESVLVAAIILGLAEFLKNAAVLTVIAVAGGAMLLWMGIDMLRNAGKLTLLSDETNSQPGGLVNVHPFWAGILTSLSNPYWILWWATIGLGYLIISRKLGLTGLTVFLVGHVMADLVWYTVVGALAAGGKHWLSDRLYRGIIRVCAVTLVFFAIYFGWHGLNGISL